MGYSARYHATSLIAIFFALAIGILIGAEFGGDALTETRKNLEQSLVGNLQDARSRADDLSSELGRADEFDERVYPVLTRERLEGRRIAVIAMGGLPSEITSAVAKKENGVVMTSSPGPTPNAMRAMIEASVPLETARQCFVPM